MVKVIFGLCELADKRQKDIQIDCVSPVDIFKHFIFSVSCGYLKHFTFSVSGGYFKRFIFLSVVDILKHFIFLSALDI